MIEVSLVIPILNEESSITSLVSSIQNQSVMPDEVIFVDGGSTDRTIEIVEELALQNNLYKLVKAGKATPGRGRNVGVTEARCQWIAFTDAGIRLDVNWLKLLIDNIKKDASIDVVYGNCIVKVETFFARCAVFAYVSPKQDENNEWRCGPFIASSLMRRIVWEQVGGFPDARAAEDLIFMEAVEKAGFKIDYAPQAKVFWQLRPDALSTFQKFVLYSKHNVWVKRQWDWHYGILRQYLIILPFIVLSLTHSRWWLLVILAWTVIRTAKRIIAHRGEFGLAPIFNPLVFLEVTLLIFMIDTATFVGWGQAVWQKNEQHSHPQ